jgi:nucleotide-binding universal stress UspA family protein
VHVISVTEPGSTAFPPTAACEYLSRHGIHAALHDRHAAPDDVGDALLRGVGEVDAAFVVMGAYGRPRALELLLGGVTRHMLARCPVPLLLAH